MKLIDNRLFIEFQEMVDSGISGNTIRNAKLRKAASWSFMDDPADKRRVLIEFECLKDEYKNAITANLGDPYKRVAQLPIRQLVKFDDEAERFYLDYRYTGTDGKPTPLPKEHVDKYTKQAGFLNMLKLVTDDKKKLKDFIKQSLTDFWNHVFEIIETDGIGLPCSYKRLAAIEDSKLKKYVREGYESLIDGRFGKQSGNAKVNDEVSQSVLLEMIAHHNQYDDVLIQIQYNKWARDNGYKTIDDKTVGLWRRKTEKQTIMFREGNADLKGKYLRQVKGFRPTAPMFLVESDDNSLDLLFIDPNDTTQHKHYHRYVSIVVTDSFNDYVLGYAYAEKLTHELVRAAYLNAMYNIRRLTGGWYLPHETKTDRWALKELQPFYESVGKYFPTPVGSKNRGYIENFFGSIHWKRCIKIGANNYNGNNMTARYRGVNTDALAINKKNYPTVGGEAAQQIETFFHRLRHVPQSNGISKEQQWLDAFHSLPAEQKRLVNDEQFLFKFGIQHNPERPIRITNRGVEPQISGTRYSYDLQTANLSDYVGKAVTVVYDPFDMSRVLVTDFNSVRLVGTEARLSSRALQDSQTDSRIFLNSVLTERSRDVESIAEREQQRKRVLKQHGFDAEAILQAGVMTKEIKMAAEQKMLVPVNGNHEEDYLDQM